MSASIPTPSRKVSLPFFMLTGDPLMDDSYKTVYASNMPTTLPPFLVARRLAQQTLLAILFGLRAIVIAIVWLALLPWITIWTWRLYFTMGESTYDPLHLDIFMNA